MFLPKPYIFRIAIRYLSAKQDNRFINFISLTSIIGIFLGVSVLITVLSIMNGFQTELRTRILSMTAHMTIFEKDHHLSNWQSVRTDLLKHPNIVGVAPFIEKQALLSAGKNVKGALIKGIDPAIETDVSSIAEDIEKGTLEDLNPGEFNVILGITLAAELKVTIGDKITLVIPQPASGLIASVPRLKRFTVTGLLNVGMHEYDSGYAFIHIEDAAKLYSMRDKISRLQIKTDDLFKVNQIIDSLNTYLPDKDYYALSWTQQHANFFQAIQLEKRIMFIVVALIIAVAAFNIVSTMVMMVNEKARAIAILRTQGARTRDITTLFIFQGITLGLIGTLLGCLGGYVLSDNIGTIIPFIEQTFNLQFFPADVYYISKVPAEINLSDVVEVGLFAFLMSVIATIYPALRASNVEPAQVLRYE